MTCPPRSSNKAGVVLSQLICAAAFAAALCLWVPVGAAAAEGAIPKLARAQKWQVGPISTANKDEDRFFCSAKARFDNGVTLVIGRDTAGGQTLAIEYDSDLYSAGATLPVVLQAAGQQQQTNALAATRRILLLGLSRNGVIEAQFLANAVLDIMVQRQRSLFAIGGYGAVTDSLDACLTTMSSGEDFEPVKMDADAPPETFTSSGPITEKTVQRFSNVTPEEARSFNPAEAARAAMLQDEVERLRRQNQELLLQRQAIDSQILVQQATAPVDMPVAPVIQRSVKQIGWPSSETFENMIATYMTTEAARCPADFAQTQGRVYKTSAGAVVREIELACLGTPEALGGTARDYAATMLFIGGQGDISVMSFQGAAGLIEQALAERAKALGELGIAP